MVTIDPQNPVVRPDQTVRLMCRAAGPIKSCLWEINKELYSLAEGQRFQPYGRPLDGECGIQVSTRRRCVYSCTRSLSVRNA